MWSSVKGVDPDKMTPGYSLARHPHWKPRYHAASRLSLTNYSLHPQIRVGYKFQRLAESKGGHIVIPRFTFWATVPQLVRAYALFLFTVGVLMANDGSFAADKLREIGRASCRERV